MDNNTQALLDYFNKSWSSMIELLNHARSVEFLIRIAAEIIEHKEFANSKSWEEFKNAPTKTDRKKLEHHIDDIWGENSEKMKLVKQLCDKLAHADYLGARNRVEAYKQKFNLKSVLNTDPAKIMSVERIKHEDGTIGGIKYTLQSNADNITLEEYMVFESQGYAQAAMEILDEARKEIEKEVPRLPLKCSALVMSRGLRFGDRE